MASLTTFDIEKSSLVGLLLSTESWKCQYNWGEKETIQLNRQRGKQQQCYLTSDMEDNYDITI